MKAFKKSKSFDAVAASRRWRARSSRELAGLTYQQLQARLSKFATADALVKPAPRHTRRKVVTTA
jgi:hypothetical protein